MKKYLLTLGAMLSLVTTSSVFSKVTITNTTPYQSTINTTWLGNPMPPFALAPGKTEVRGHSNSFLVELSAVITVPGQGNVVAQAFKSNGTNEAKLIIAQDANNQFTIKRVK